ncbi:MAG: FG-GAP-like repeat-containing protein [Planctomycetota bacterium]
MNDGSGTFRDATTRMPLDDDSSLAVAAADVDLDGDVDLFVANSGERNRLYLNDGSGGFGDATEGRLPLDLDRTETVATGDVDGDGDADVIFGNRQFARDKLYLNDGGGVFVDVTSARLPASGDDTLGVGLGDVDGDGDLDLLLAKDLFLSTGRQNRLYLNDGSGVFIDATATRLPSVIDETSSVALADVDGDGDLDVMFGNHGQDRLYLNNGLGFFRDTTGSALPSLGDATEAVAFADFDGDGDDDLVVGTRDLSGPREDRLLVNDGAGRFTLAPLSPRTEPTGDLAVGDLDRDGDEDLVLGGTAVRVYTNLRRHLEAPLIPVLGRGYRLEALAQDGALAAPIVAWPIVSVARSSVLLPGIGVLGLDPMQLVALPPFPVPPGGPGGTTLALPALPSLAGWPLFSQALILGAGGQARLTNVVADELIP